MQTAGFVLVGGRSSRMGCDKALLPYGSKTLAQHVAEVVAEAAGNVTLIGPPNRYAHLGFPVVADLRAGLGPLSGIETALSLGVAEWNLVVACDLPAVQGSLLKQLLQFAAECDADCVFPVARDGMSQPLLAAWHARAQPRVRFALDSGIRKVMNCVEKCRIVPWPAEVEAFENMNTPEEWKAFLTR